MLHLFVKGWFPQNNLSIIQDLLKKCHQCVETIVKAKDQQAAEANKNASILLKELDLEKVRGCNSTNIAVLHSSHGLHHSHDMIDVRGRKKKSRSECCLVFGVIFCSVPVLELRSPIPPLLSFLS